VGRVAWTDEASRWLRRIYEYIAADDAAAAMRTVRGILDKAQMLGRLPELGQQYQRHADRHIRVVRYGHYRIAYLLKPEGDVDVLGVFHERLDIKRYLDE
jgi:plasmid stabilization system protein ParE